jgi:hypothetical protein
LNLSSLCRRLVAETEAVSRDSGDAQKLQATRLSPSQLSRRGKMRRVIALTTAGVVLLLAGAVAASGGLSSGPYVAAESTTMTTTQTTPPTTVRFSFSVKARKGRVRTRASGHGTLTLAEPPQAPRTPYTSTSATGVIKFHRWKLGGRDEDDFTMNVTSGDYRFNRAAAYVNPQGPVTKAASLTTDLCYPGAAGAFYIGDGKVKRYPSYVELEMCGVDLSYRKGVAGYRVVVTIKVEPPTG